MYFMVSSHDAIMMLFEEAGFSRHDVESLVGKAAVRRNVFAHKLHAGFVVDVSFQMHAPVGGIHGQSTKSFTLKILRTSHGDMEDSRGMPGVSGPCFHPGYR